MRSSIVLGVSFMAACGNGGDDGGEVDCTQEMGTDVFVVGLAKVGQAGMLNFSMMSADPAPPARGDNTWVFQINTMDSGVVGAPVDGAQLAVTPFMPAHQHGSPIQVVVTPEATPGQYKLDPVNLWMPGVWETTIRATAATTSDSVVFRFCVN